MINTQDVKASSRFDYSSVIKNTRTTGYNTTGTTEDQPVYTSQDISSISSVSKFLFENKLTLSASSSEFDGVNLNFDLSFNYSHAEKISAKGYYKSNSGEVNLNMNFTFKARVLENGILKTKNYLAEVNFSSRNFNSLSINKSKEKEDIFAFLNRVVEKIVEVMNNDDANLTAVIFDKDDLKDIVEMTDPKMRDMVNQIINIALITARLKQILKKNEGKEQEDVILKPKRVFTDIKTSYASTSYISDYNISITEIPPQEDLPGSGEENEDKR